MSCKRGCKFNCKTARLQDCKVTREAAGEEHAGIPWLKMENIRTNGYSIIRGARLFPLNYSHSMVDGGLDDMS